MGLSSIPVHAQQWDWTSGRYGLRKKIGKKPDKTGMLAMSQEVIIEEDTTETDDSD